MHKCVFFMVKIHALFRILVQVRENCVAAIGAMYFSCVASAAHFFVLGGKDYEQQI